MNKSVFFLILFFLMMPVQAQEPSGKDLAAASAVGVPLNASAGSADIFDDKTLIQGYADKLADSPKDLLLAMINDDNLYAYKKTAAVRVFRGKFALQMVSTSRSLVEKMLLRQLELSSSVHLKIEIMHTMVIMDRFRYFDAMVPLLVQKMDHYDSYVDQLAYAAIEDITTTATPRAREARIVFTTLRKMFFLERKKIMAENPLTQKLRNKLQLLRWSIKVLGTEELKSLPPEVINLM
jgi:hypothetical protein